MIDASDGHENGTLQFGIVYVIGRLTAFHQTATTGRALRAAFEDRIELAGMGCPPGMPESGGDLGAEAVELDGRGSCSPQPVADRPGQLRKCCGSPMQVSAVSFRTQRGYDTPAELDARVEATKAPCAWQPR